MRPNKIKQMWRDGKNVTLGWLSVSHGFTAEVMARQGFDALCVDLQHGTSEITATGRGSGSRRTTARPWRHRRGRERRGVGFRATS